MKNLIALLAALFLTYLAAMATAFAAEDSGAVRMVDGKTSDRVHLRSEPSTESASLGLYFSGAPVRCLDRVDSVWTRVAIGAESGYMMSRYLTEDAESDACITPYVFSAEDTVLLTAPNAEGEKLLSVGCQTSLRLLGETRERWSLVETEEGVQGYLRSESLALLPCPMPVPERMSDYLPVLTGDGAFWDMDAWDTPAERTLSDYLRAYELTSFSTMALADIDGDGRREVLLCAETEGEAYHLLLDADESTGTVRGCTLSYRAFLSPKSDGTFSFSSSAFDSGSGWVTFTQDGYELRVLLESVWEKEDQIGYRLNGKPCSEKIFDEALQCQTQKPELMWYPVENGQLPTGLLAENDL